MTGARKAAQLSAALERRGATAVAGPLVTTDHPAADETILAESERVVAAGPRWLAASTGVGMRLWAEVADRHGHGAALRRALAPTRVVARGAKAVGGLAALGLTPEHVTSTETDEAVADWLLAHAVPGETVAAQLHGGAPTTFDRLGTAGLQVTTVRPYVAGRRPADEERARALVLEIVNGELDVVTFTSPAAARNLFDLADEMGADVLAGVEHALRQHRVAVAVIGPVTAEVLRRRDVPIAVAPDRHRQGELVRALEQWASQRR